MKNKKNIFTRYTYQDRRLMIDRYLGRYFLVDIYCKYVMVEVSELNEIIF